MPAPLAATIVPAAILGAASLGNALSTFFTNRENADAQREVNAKNLAFAREQFEYQKYLNRNQYGMAVQDMQSAGLNPLLLSGSPNMSSGSFDSRQQASQMVAPQLDISPLISLAETKMSNETQKQIAENNNATSLHVAETQAASNEKIASLQAQTQQAMLTRRLSQEDRQFQSKLAQDFSIENIKAEIQRRGIESQEAIEAAKRVSEQLKRDDDYKLAQENIRLEEERIKNAKTQAERDAAIRSRNGWLNFASSIFHTVVNGAISIFNGTTSAGTSNPVGFRID